MPSDVLESWIKGYLEPRYPELVEPIREADRIGAAAVESGHLSAEDLSRLLAIATSPRQPLSNNVSEMLGRLAGQFSAVRDVIRTMARDKRAHVRINALIALHGEVQSPLRAEVLSVALRDRSARVRALAADKVMLFGLRSLLTDLEEAIAREAQPKLRATLAWERDLLRDGFRIADSGEKRVVVTCRTGAGTISTSFSRSDMDTKGHQWIKENAVPATD